MMVLLLLCSPLLQGRSPALSSSSGLGREDSCERLRSCWFVEQLSSLCSMPGP